MGFKDILNKIGERHRERKELFRQADEQLRIQETLENRRKSANERELERFMKEKREEQIKYQLDIERKEREEDIRFNHNPLDVKNITSGTEWEVLKERNQFSGKGNMFTNQESIHKNNRKLLDNGNILKSNMRLIG